MGSVKFTKNTIEIRKFLELNKFYPLIFFQGRTYIYAFITIRANKNGNWKEKDYATFDLSDMQRMDYLDKEVSEIEFKKYIESL